MKVYIAHNFSARSWLPEVIRELEGAGHTCTSRWITNDEHVGISTKAAIADLEDIDRADILLLYTDQPPTSRPARGKYTELGYAYAKGKNIFLIGEAEDCIFYVLPGVTRVKSISEFLEKI